VATLGKASEEALARHGIAHVISPPLRFDSEALLELPELQQVAGKRIVIFRGDGGRDLLGDTLRARGAIVEFVACYRRQRPSIDPAPLLRLWEAGRLDAVTLTSSEGLRNFCEMVGPLGRAWLRRTPTVVSHQRIAEQAQALGLQQVIAAAPGDQGLIDALVQYYAHDGTKLNTDHDIASRSA
jgi:uroporphyrinogen-III synthase